MIFQENTALYTQFCKSYDLATGAIRGLAEGTAMVHKIENGAAVIDVSTGATGEVFAGFSIARPGDVNRLVEVYTVKVPDTGLVSLRHKANISDMRVDVKNADGTFTNITLQMTGTVDATHANVTDNGNKLQFDTSLAEETLRIAAGFVPTTIEASARYGMNINGIEASAPGNVTVIYGGGQTVATDMIDMSADWTSTDGNPRKVYLGANGRFTTAGSSSTPVATNVILIEAPSEGSPYAVFRTM
jgi:VCBS repeat-containing protein